MVNYAYDDDSSNGEDVVETTDTTSKTTKNATGEQLKAYIERVEKVDAEVKDLSECKKEIYSEMKGNGFDVKAVREIIRLRKKSLAERQELEDLVDTYLHAIGDQA
jgi:uncharacterized protein (UPF0335 family)